MNIHNKLKLVILIHKYKENLQRKNWGINCQLFQKRIKNLNQKNILIRNLYKRIKEIKNLDMNKMKDYYRLIKKIKKN